MTSFNIFSLNRQDYLERIDTRFKDFLYENRFLLVEQYKGTKVYIPGTWNSSFHPVKYFSVVKEPGDPNYNANQEENEISLTLWGGWEGYDHEVEINLFISGKDVLQNPDAPVRAEILKCGGAPMTLYIRKFSGELSKLTDFKKRTWFGFRDQDKVWFPRLQNKIE